jgi:hypothetical protein
MDRRPSAVSPSAASFRRSARLAKASRDIFIQRGPSLVLPDSALVIGSHPSPPMSIQVSSNCMRSSFICFSSMKGRCPCTNRLVFTLAIGAPTSFPRRAFDRNYFADCRLPLYRPNSFRSTIVRTTYRRTMCTQCDCKSGLADHHGVFAQLGSLTTRTGHGAVRTTSSERLPQISRLSPVRPCVPITSKTPFAFSPIN